MPQDKQPSLIVAEALTAWADPPRLTDPALQADWDHTSRQFQEFIDCVCRNHGLEIVRKA
jgi:hypothetical protein